MRDTPIGIGVSDPRGAPMILSPISETATGHIDARLCDSFPTHHDPFCLYFTCREKQGNTDEKGNEFGLVSDQCRMGGEKGLVATTAARHRGGCTLPAHVTEFCGVTEFRASPGSDPRFLSHPPSFLTSLCGGEHTHMC